ncbi:hypothetical protein [Microbulbifer spongiae]|uniref:Uncharacterized protein n=1 Tax=Microbulbifer spongiae TaxID=2944933 RepID=A0ABY9E7P4_9GAMM|nr:hypothetical protein [Microbulbifer sp. MI-G]WKD49035.1 hypothetical protein M8T91_14190 [Microbulbifer sp. MI-G]
MTTAQIPCTRHSIANQIEEPALKGKLIASTDGFTRVLHRDPYEGPGSTCIPFDADGINMRSAMPKKTRMLAGKYSNLVAPIIEQGMELNHNRKLACSYRKGLPVNDSPVKSYGILSISFPDWMCLYRQSLSVPVKPACHPALVDGERQYTAHSAWSMSPDIDCIPVTWRQPLDVAKPVFLISLNWILKSSKYRVQALMILVAQIILMRIGVFSNSIPIFKFTILST